MDTEIHTTSQSEAVTDTDATLDQLMQALGLPEVEHVPDFPGLELRGADTLVVHRSHPEALPSLINVFRQLLVENGIDDQPLDVILDLMEGRYNELASRVKSEQCAKAAYVGHYQRTMKRLRKLGEERQSSRHAQFQAAFAGGLAVRSRSNPQHLLAN